MNQRSSVYSFSSLDNAGFNPADYSCLKFGSDIAARDFGYLTAENLFAKHAETLLARPVLVIPSPYNHVANAATIMTRHLVNRLNELLVEANGAHVEYDTIRRKVSYISDYGFLSAAKRRALIGKDSFYLNRDFYVGKTLVFVDDVRITGAHEDRLIEVLVENGVTNDAIFTYFAEYEGDDPKIEAALNFAAVKDIDDYREIAREVGHHIIMRPIKYLLSYPDKEDLRVFFMDQPHRALEEIYHGALGEGFNHMTQYQAAIKLLSGVLNPKSA